MGAGAAAGVWEIRVVGANDEVAGHSVQRCSCPREVEHPLAGSSIDELCLSGRSSHTVPLHPVNERIGLA